MIHATFKSPIGRLIAVEDAGQLIRILLATDVATDYGEAGNSDVLDQTLAQLGQYFAGARREFELPLAPLGTTFQQSVWKALREIPFGETKTYADIAIAIGNPKAGRAVGGANNHNPIPIVIPCHRVIGKDGSLVGYRGGLAVKQQLLDLERQHG